MNSPLFAFQVKTIWAVQWFTTRALDFTAPLYPAFITEPSDDSAVNVTFLGLSLGSSTSYLAQASSNGCIWLLSQSCAIRNSLATQSP